MRVCALALRVQGRDTLLTIRLLNAIALDGAPTEFRIFRPGVNETTKGAVTFDRIAADAVMAAYRAHGVEHMIDLEHESLDPPTRPDSRDARGWYELALRETPAGPELWAVNVRWTADGLRRLSEKTQRYISPAFWPDEDGRVAVMVNCALTSLPATHGAQALVAASHLRDREGRARAPITIDVDTRIRASRILEKYSQWAPTKSKQQSKP